jgi:hypothetical protein
LSAKYGTLRACGSRDRTVLVRIGRENADIRWMPRHVVAVRDLSGRSSSRPWRRAGSAFASRRCPDDAALGAAQYTTRYTAIANGAITFTGNSLGLDAASGQNGQGTRGSIGTFSTTNTALQDATPAPTGVPAFPPGTTADWRQNSSAAELRLPAGARVLRAELVWGGSWAYGGENVSASLNDAITLTTPSGSFAVTPDPSTARTTGSGTGNCIPGPSCFYFRSADVTALVPTARRMVNSGARARPCWRRRFDDRTVGTSRALEPLSL